MHQKIKIKTLVLPFTLIAFLIAMAANPQAASAHEWTLTVNGKVQKIKAKVVNFDGTNVLLEADNGVKKSFPINELTDEDLEYVKNIVVARQTAVSEQMNLKQFQQERLRNQLEYRDIWAVKLYASNGTYVIRRFLARSSREAIYRATQQFPNARIGGVRKIRREGSLQL